MTDLHRKPNGRYELRWRENGRRCSRTFNLRGDAVKFEANRVRRKQLGHAAVPDDIPLREFVLTYWRLHAIPNLAASTRAYYLHALTNHIEPRLGDYGVRDLTPKRIGRFREELEHAGLGASTIRKTMAILQSILSFAVAEEIVEFNAARHVRKPRYERAREPRIFLPAEVEAIRAQLNMRDRTLVSVLAYSGPRPQEVVCALRWSDIGERTIRYVGTKKGGKVRFTPLLRPLADDLREWFLASGRPDGNRPIFPAHDGGFWDNNDWGNWRTTIWKGSPERKYNRRTFKAHVGCAPSDTRPRDLRSSFITVQVYAGVPLTTLARQCGTSVLMIEKHYAGVIENWDGKQTPAEMQIMAARGAPGRSMDVTEVAR